MAKNSTRDAKPAAMRPAPIWTRIVLAAALFAASFGDTAAAGSAEAYKLAPGDKLTVTVLGQAELSGEFPLDSAGQIQFPIVGSVDMRGLTVLESQSRLTERLADGILNDPSVFVRITELRPIQILGDVKSPGSYPFRYGTIVKSAAALAGGFGFSQQSPGAAMTEYLAADERARVLETTRGRLLIRQARLRAQAGNAENFDPAEIAENAGANVHDAETGKFLDDERSAFAARTGEFKKQIDLINAQKPALVSESEAIDGQIASEKKQLELIKEQIDAYEKLRKTGLTKLDSMIQIELSAATKESSLWRLEADRSRLRTAIGELDIRLQDADTAYKKQVANELQDVVQRLHEISVTLPTAREVRDTKFREIGSPVAGSGKREIVITRVRDTDVSTLDASETTLLEPGDIVEIKVPKGSETARSPLASLPSPLRNAESVTASASDNMSASKVSNASSELRQP